MFKGFKNFVLRGNALDLAVGVVIGATFGSVVDSLVKDLLTPFISVIARVPDLAGLEFSINGSVFRVGAFANTLVSFVLLSASVYFFVITPLNKFLPKKTAPVSTKKCGQCKSEVSVDATRCAFCTQVLESH